MAKIIGVIGFINSGKGTVASELVKNHNFRQDSFAKSLKDACAVIFDWPRQMLEGDTSESREWRELVDPWWAEQLNIPNFSPRLALQLIGTDTLRDHFNTDIWQLSLRNRIQKNSNQNVVISDVRFLNEIKFIQDHGGVIVRVIRGVEPVWYETANLANKGNNIAKDIMAKTYSHIHSSEWAWIGSTVDYTITNDGTIEDLSNQINTLISNLE